MHIRVHNVFSVYSPVSILGIYNVFAVVVDKTFFHFHFLINLLSELVVEKLFGPFELIVDSFGRFCNLAPHLVMQRCRLALFVVALLLDSTVGPN